MEFELWHYGLLFFVAFFSGFVDAVAGGGGLITVPALLSVGLPEHIALATNKLQSTFGSFTATVNFSLKGLIDYKELFAGIIFTFIGAVLGTAFVLVIDAKILSYLIPVFLVLIFVYTILSPKIGEEDRSAKLSPKVFYIAFGLILGFYDGFFGPGTGSFWMFAMVALLGIHMKKSRRSYEGLKLYIKCCFSGRFYSWWTDTLDTRYSYGFWASFGGVFWFKNGY
ncbi:inner membrane protein YfcA [Campylobacter hyointestinalis subsp. hyointestinalis]|nr:inner membrane protein YfcA [Campylobacter hyointestinalis subsp. hyointestinalis]